jgi:uncharacterized membrane protein YebE (DUF533 family)
MILNGLVGGGLRVLVIAGRKVRRVGVVALTHLVRQVAVLDVLPRKVLKPAEKNKASTAERSSQAKQKSASWPNRQKEVTSAGRASRLKGSNPHSQSTGSRALEM